MGCDSRFILYHIRCHAGRAKRIVRGTLEIETLSFEQGGVTTPIEDRPHLRFLERASDTDLGAPPADPGCPWVSEPTTATP